MAPVGTMILAPVARALSTRYIRGRRAPTEDGTNIRPDSIAAVAISSNADAGAASTYVEYVATASRGRRAVQSAGG